MNDSFVTSSDEWMTVWDKHYYPNHMRAFWCRNYSQTNHWPSHLCASGRSVEKLSLAKSSRRQQKGTLFFRQIWWANAWESCLLSLKNGQRELTIINILLKLCHSSVSGYRPPFKMEVDLLNSQISQRQTLQLKRLKIARIRFLTSDRLHQVA